MCRDTGGATSVPEPRKGAQKFSFQAEVSRLMDIIIHSLYSNKVRLGGGTQHRVSAYSSSTELVSTTAGQQQASAFCSRERFPVLLSRWSLKALCSVSHSGMTCWACSERTSMPLGMQMCCCQKLQ